MHLIIRGRVQGVFFRATAKKKADELGVTGWVKNTPDGAVEMHAEGDEQSLISFKEWCSKGPEGAKVEEVKTETAIENGCTEFIIES